MSYERIAELFSYDPETGKFITLKQTSYLFPVGQIRPIVMKKETSKSVPQPAIRINGFYRRAPHIAYLLMNKTHVPDGHGLFFKNWDSTDLRWSNMVLADNRCGGKFQLWPSK